MTAFEGNTAVQEGCEAYALKHYCAMQIYKVTANPNHYYLILERNI